MAPFLYDEVAGKTGDGELEALWLRGGFQLVKPGAQAYYWRTAAGAEADLLMDLGPKKISFEVKLHTAPRRI